MNRKERLKGEAANFDYDYGDLGDKMKPGNELHDSLVNYVLELVHEWEIGSRVRMLEVILFRPPCGCSTPHIDVNKPLLGVVSNATSLKRWNQFNEVSKLGSRDARNHNIRRLA